VVNVAIPDGFKYAVPITPVLSEKITGCELVTAAPPGLVNTVAMNATG
jgi:hypothetical protein